MQLYAVARGLPDVGEPEVAAALRGAAAAFPELDERTMRSGGSRDRRLAFAAVAHAPEAAAPRRYFARRGADVVLFDGLPLPLHDAEQLLERWGEAELEGVFSAIRIDLDAGEVDVALDVLGMAKLFCASRDGGMVLSNSVEAVRLLLGATEADPLGVSSMLGLGWAAGGRTLLRDVSIVEGPITPERMTPRHRVPDWTAASVADSLTDLARSARAFDPLTCGLTAGRDTRVVLAIALAAGLDASYYTSGYEDEADVVIARMLARELGLRHDLVTPELPDDWTAATTAFSSQTDGLASLGIVSDWIENCGHRGRVGLRLWGPGGEIGRAGNIGLAIPFGANTPGLRSSVAVQRRILHRKVDDFGGLVTPAAVATTRAHLDRFVAQRLEEGWRPRELAEAYYAFERVRYWASTGVRRVSAATDLWSPFVSRPFIEYCWSLTPEERTIEAPHWRILSHLDTRVRDLPFEHPWRPQRPKRASAMVARDVVRKALTAARGERSRSTRPVRPPFGADWVAAGRGEVGEVIAGSPHSPLWDYVHRDELVRRLAAPDEGVRRAISVLWWLEGRGR